MGSSDASGDKQSSSVPAEGGVWPAIGRVGKVLGGIAGSVAVLFVVGFLARRAVYQFAGLPMLSADKESLAETGGDVFIKSVSSLFSDGLRLTLLIALLTLLLLIALYRERIALLRRLQESAIVCFLAESLVLILTVLALYGLLQVVGQADPQRRRQQLDEISQRVGDLRLQRGEFAKTQWTPIREAQVIARATYPASGLFALYRPAFVDRQTAFEEKGWQDSVRQVRTLGHPLRRSPIDRRNAKTLYGWMAFSMLLLLVCARGARRWRMYLARTRTRAQVDGAAESTEVETPDPQPQTVFQTFFPGSTKNAESGESAPHESPEVAPPQAAKAPRDAEATSTEPFAAETTRAWARAREGVEGADREKPLPPRWFRRALRWLGEELPQPPPRIWIATGTYVMSPLIVGGLLFCMLLMPTAFGVLMVGFIGEEKVTVHLKDDPKCSAAGTELAASQDTSGSGAKKNSRLRVRHCGGEATQRAEKATTLLVSSLRDLWTDRRRPDSDEGSPIARFRMAIDALVADIADNRCQETIDAFARHLPAPAVVDALPGAAEYALKAWQAVRARYARSVHGIILHQPRGKDTGELILFRPISRGDLQHQPRWQINMVQRACIGEVQVDAELAQQRIENTVTRALATRGPTYGGPLVAKATETYSEHAAMGLLALISDRRLARVVQGPVLTSIGQQGGPFYRLSAEMEQEAIKQLMYFVNQHDQALETRPMALEYAGSALSALNMIGGPWAAQQLAQEIDAIEDVRIRVFLLTTGGLLIQDLVNWRDSLKPQGDNSVTDSQQPTNSETWIDAIGDTLFNVILRDLKNPQPPIRQAALGALGTGGIWNLHEAGKTLFEFAPSTDGERAARMLAGARLGIPDLRDEAREMVLNGGTPEDVGLASLGYLLAGGLYTEADLFGRMVIDQSSLLLSLKEHHKHELIGEVDAHALGGVLLEIAADDSKSEAVRVSAIELLDYADRDDAIWIRQAAQEFLQRSANGLPKPVSEAVCNLKAVQGASPHCMPSSNFWQSIFGP